MDESHTPTAVQFVYSICSNTHVFPAMLHFFSLYMYYAGFVVELICAQEFVVDVEDSSLLM